MLIPASAKEGLGTSPGWVVWESGGSFCTCVWRQESIGVTLRFGSLAKHGVVLVSKFSPRGIHWVGQQDLCQRVGPPRQGPQAPRWFTDAYQTQQKGRAGKDSL